MKRQPTPAQKAAAEERRARLRELWQRVSEMTEEQRAAYVEKVGTITTCEGHALSAGNTILLAYQADNISVVGGYNQWKSAGRPVSKGQKALGIWIPKTSAKDGEPQPEKPEYFIFGSVFDISQTEPIEAQS